MAENKVIDLQEYRKIHKPTPVWGDSMAETMAKESEKFTALMRDKLEIMLGREWQE